MEKDKPNNPNAFACAAGEEFLQEGMSLRDYFAAKALPSVIQSYTKQMEDDINQASILSYKIADAMLKQREL